MKIALVVGHSEDEQNPAKANGADGLTEFAYNKELVQIVFRKMADIMLEYAPPKPEIDARIFYRTIGISALIDDVLEFGADLTISFHCNSHAKGTVRGTEVLIWTKHYYDRMKEDLTDLARILSERISLILDTRNRTVKPTRRNDRGGQILSQAPNCLMIESFFMSNSEDVKSGIENQEVLGEAIGAMLVAYAIDWETK
jgi:hypothetical protein